MEDEEKKIIEEALKQGKLVVIRGISEARVRIRPEDRVVVITRR